LEDACFFGGAYAGQVFYRYDDLDAL